MGLKAVVRNSERDGGGTDSDAGDQRSAGVSVVARHGGLAFMRRVGEWLDQATEDAPSDWGLFVGSAAVLAFLLVAGLRLIALLALDTHSAVVGWIGVAPALVSALFFIGVLVWVYVRIRLDRTDKQAYVVALLSSIIAVAVCTEAFATATTVLWQHGWLTARASYHADLWTTERYYLWHLADAVPLLSVPTTLGWTEPRLFVDHLSGSLALAFRLLVIAPLLRIAISGYIFTQDQWRARRLRDVEKAEKESAERPVASSARRGAGPYRWAAPVLPSRYRFSAVQLRARFTPMAIRWRASDAWLACVEVLLATVAAVIVLIFVSDPSSALDRWVSGRAAGHAVIAGEHISLSWLRTAPQWVAAVILVVVLAIVVRVVAAIELVRIQSLAEILGTVLCYLGLIALMTMVWAAVALPLLRLGVISARPAVPPTGQLSSLLSPYAWHTADAIPGLKLPSTLNWTLRHDLVDHWSGVLLLAYKAAFFGVLLFPIATLVATYLERRRPLAPAALSVASEFSRRLETVQASLKQASGSVSDYVTQRDNMREVNTTESSPGNLPWLELRQSLNTSARDIAMLAESTAHVISLFGRPDASHASAAATEAVGTAEKHLAVLERAWWSRDTAAEQASIDTTNRALSAASRKYVEAAAAELRQASTPADSGNRGTKEA